MSLEFRKRFAFWSRLEPRCRSTDFADGLAARVADPLWMLARQWQLGEFAAADGGSPVRADLEYRTTPLTHVRLGVGTGPEISLDGAPPLETLVEREPIAGVRGGDTIVEYRMRVRAGQRLERELRRALGAAADAAIRSLRRKFPLRLPDGEALGDIDRATRRYVSLMEGRVVDGIDALAAVEAGGAPHVAASIEGFASDPAPLIPALDALREWHAQLFSQPPAPNPAWVPDRLAYSFGARAGEGGEITALTAPLYRNGELDWHSVCLDSAPASVGPGAATSSFLPTGLSFGGMPNRRWWAFEDSRVDLGGLDASTTDLAKLALVEFALIYADDWFMYPLVVPAGSVTRIATLRVTDSFGRSKPIPRGRTEGTSAWDRWEMFTLSPTARPRAAGNEHVLFVPPAVGFREESEPLEVVRFARDEGANKVWGIERTITNALGDGVGGPGAHRERLELRREGAGVTTTVDATGDGLLDAERGLIRYRIQTYVPHNWIPFAPVRASADGTSIRLRRARMLLNETSREPEAIPGLSRLLMGEGGPDWLNEEAVLRHGLTVQLTRQRVRSIDGKTYVWLGRNVRMGHGEASSGLRFDVVEPV